ncbi:N-acetyltransferase [Polymorphobacter glacialis]|uniref:N-acetyltransferase n=1 Tax=Sandarakinorhabdus glacialis TaxID=1614636 RepID=A0A917E8Z4_9SPHN|nr:GNAT family N-acetyltransferase [Polymorphobacter glacialis]GGE15080.1 N-acetyltransferase [Polymorphobacter glacialis]
MTVRLAQSGDLPLLGAVEASAALLFLGTPMAFAINDPLTPVDTLATAMARQTLWVAANANDAPLGFLIAEPVGAWLHIVGISVAAEAQRHGHGTALLAAIIDAAPRLNCTCLSLTTDREIAWNAPLYGRHGFVELAQSTAPFWLLAILLREASMGFNPARRCAMFRPL